MKFFKLLYISLLIGFQSYAQDSIEINGSISTNVYTSSEELPFWFYRNTNGFVKEETNVGLNAFAKAEYNLSENTSLEGGISLLYRDGAEQQAQRGNLFVRFRAKYYQITVGAEDPNEANVLSSTNQNIILSGNTRPFPGIVIESPEYIAITKSVSVDYGIGHYVLNDDRFVENTRVHYKRLNVKYDTESSGSFSAGVQHFAQWGGVSPVSGALPNGVGDFVKIFLAQAGGDNSVEGEQVNALGNHLGSFDFTYEKIMRKGLLKLYHLHLFEDGSGTAFKNFPDGVWGIDYKFEKPSLITNILYEYVDTRSQSGSSGRSARDNYFSNKGYRSGWTYEGDIIGLPFFQLNPDTGLGITNNRVVAHHFGVSSVINKFNFVAKLTYLQSLGTYAAPIEPRQKSVLSYLLTSYTTEKWGSFTLLLGADITNYRSNTLGGSLGYVYRL